MGAVLTLGIMLLCSSAPGDGDDKGRARQLVVDGLAALEGGNEFLAREHFRQALVLDRTATLPPTAPRHAHVLFRLAKTSLPEHGASSPSVARRFAHAVAAEEALEYEEALATYQMLTQTAGLSDERLLGAHLRAGVLSVILDRRVEARVHFLYVLEHRPGIKLPPETTPKVVRFFELMRAERALAGGESSNDDEFPSAPPSTGAAGDGEVSGSPIGSAMMIGGLSVVGVGALAAVLGVAGAAFSGFVVWGSPSSPGALKAVARPVGDVSVAVLALGLVGVMTGGGLVAMSWVVE